MTFSPEEYERRLRELRERMEARRLDAVILSDPKNLMYLTDHQTTGYSYFQALLVPLDGEPVAVTREMEASNIEQRTWVEEIRSYADTGDAIQMMVSVIRDLGLQDKWIGYERNSYFFPAYQQDRLRTAFADGHLCDCFGIVEEGRICKSEEEIALMTRAAAATQAGMRAGLRAAVPGVTENDIAAEVCKAMFEAGGEYPAVLPYITSGPRTMIGHATWEGREVQKGDVVFLEVGGCVRRYHTAMMRTVVPDRMEAAMHHAEERMATALRALHDFVRPGVTVSDVDMLIRDIIQENRVGARLVTRSGYSIGIAFAPSWDEGYMLSLKQGDATPLREGMTFHVIPWMWGVEGRVTVGTSDTIRVTADGCASFFDMPHEMHQMGEDPGGTEVPVRAALERRQAAKARASEDKAGKKGGKEA